MASVKWRCLPCSKLTGRDIPIQEVLTGAAVLSELRVQTSPAVREAVKLALAGFAFIGQCQDQVAWVLRAHDEVSGRTL